jgi:predicted phage terminase large subunit-like protein
MPFDARTLQALMRTDFRPFLEKAFTTLAPGQPYIHSWHLEAIAWRLEAVRLGKTRRLIINMPPRSLKSIAASVAFPAFMLGHDPSRRIVCVSYSADLAKKHSNDFRALIDASWYRATFPETRIGKFKNSESRIEFTAGGLRLATSVGGTLTGFGGDTIIIDDPLKPDDALSETKRSAANVWFANTLLPRLDDKRTGAILVVAQRVHVDDLTGFLLSQSDEWEVLNLPAIAECDDAIPTWGGRLHHRRAGEALSPEREPLHVLEALKTQMGSYAFAAQYQQMPAAPGGNMIHRDWPNRYSELPLAAERRLVLQSWDTASKGGPENDFSVCTTWIITRDKRWFLVDVWRGRVDYPSLKAKVISHAKSHAARRVLVEDAGTGIALVQELRGKVPGIAAVKPQGDKTGRMAIASDKFVEGLVYLPERAPWLPDLEAELFAFPSVRHDDQCDSISQALTDKNLFSMAMITAEQWQAANRPFLSTRARALPDFSYSVRSPLEPPY